jgi:hypothetical protein
MEQTVCLKSNHLNLKAFSLPAVDGGESADESSFKWKGRKKGFCTVMFDATQGVGGGDISPCVYMLRSFHIFMYMGWVVQSV